MNQYIPKPDQEGINAPPGSPLKDLAFMGLGFVLIVAVGFLILGFLGEWALPKMAPKLETTVFKKFVRNFHEQQVTDPQLEKIFAKLVGTNEFGLRLYVICEKSPNAFAVPGGAIFLTQGLLKDIKSEMGMAFVIAHEMGHFQHRHHLKGLGRSLGLSLGTLILGFGDSALLAGSLSEIMARAYSRDQETEADNYAISLVQKVYGNLNGSTEFFEEILKNQSGLEKFAALMSTHPMTEDRLANIKSHQKSSVPASMEDKAEPLTFKDTCTKK